MTGIYKITNKINGHAYIGYAKDIEERWKEHIRASKNDTRQASKLLYLAFNKYGIDNFNFEVIEQCSLEQLQEREIYWTWEYTTADETEEWMNKEIKIFFNIQVDQRVN